MYRSPCKIVCLHKSSITGWLTTTGLGEEIEGIFGGFGLVNRTTSIITPRSTTKPPIILCKVKFVLLCTLLTSFLSFAIHIVEFAFWKSRISYSPPSSNISGLQSFLLKTKSWKIPLPSPCISAIRGR